MRRRRRGALGARRRRGERDRRVDRARARHRRGHQGQVAGDGRDRASTRRWRREGIHALETDLAELIVQLDPDDKQSHILVPAIHRNRAEIRALFERTIAQGQSLGNEASAIAEAARLHLRSKFLSVPVAVSGANFGIAETGTIGVVESEGNGRMCLTMPRVLVTLMGIEKVLPSWQDLEVFLQLLPRSLDRRADEPVHVAVDGRAARRRAAGVPPGAARRRPHRRAGRRGRPRRRCTASAARRA